MRVLRTLGLGEVHGGVGVLSRRQHLRLPGLVDDAARPLQGNEKKIYTHTSG